MGGHSAWKKRVANGELAKGSGGAALRHHPHLGRKGKDIDQYNRLGNIGGHGNPKRKATKPKKTKKEMPILSIRDKHQAQQATVTATTTTMAARNDNNRIQEDRLFATKKLLFILVSILAASITVLLLVVVIRNTYIMYM